MTPAGCAQEARVERRDTWLHVSRVADDRGRLRSHGAGECGPPGTVQGSAGRQARCRGVRAAGGERRTMRSFL
eukprot:scaffold67729_cov70-Phaeocystis_antarctica.AAC.2